MWYVKNHASNSVAAMEFSPLHAAQWCALAICSGAIVILPKLALGVPTSWVTDQELVACPVVVVAVWDGAKWEKETQQEDRNGIVTEHRTKIRIVRVIAGDVQPGTHEITVPGSLSWSVKMPFPRPTEGPTDADIDVTKQNLWFLSSEPSGAVKKLRLPFYRSIQPLGLEEYFQALRNGTFARDAMSLLRSREAVVVERTLMQAAGGRPPWPCRSPLEAMLELEPETTLPPTREALASLRQLALERNNLPSRVRAMAVSVYAELRGTDACAELRELLGDKDANVRAIALAFLAKYRDRRALARMVDVAGNIRDGCLACNVIFSLAGCGDADAAMAVPILIEFLQNDAYCYRVGEDLGIPAVQARQALRQITGAVFPFDVSRSRQVWSLVAGIKSQVNRSGRLSSEFREDSDPWSLNFAFDQEGVIFVITNHTTLARSLALTPSDISIYLAPGRYGFGLGADPQEASDFSLVKAGDSIRWRPSFEGKKIASLIRQCSPDRRWEVSLEYPRTGCKYGVKAWVGFVTKKSPVRVRGRDDDPFQGGK